MLTFGARAGRGTGSPSDRWRIDAPALSTGLGEPPEPVVTGRRDADEMHVEPHDLGGYDDDAQ